MSRARIAAVALIGAVLAGCGTAAAPPPPPVPAASPAPACDGPATEVIGADQLGEAIADAAPGDVIRMGPGTYAGTFATTASGTADRPITLCGGRDAVIDGGDVEGDYALHLDGASHWRLLGFTIRGGQKGLMADNAQANLIEALLIEGTGDEALHLRQASSDNIVRGNEIRRTGIREPKFGEGVYIGSAESNWCEQSACGPDRSDRNTIEGNTIWQTSAESVDIKEGTTGGVLRGNSFSGEGMSGKDSDSWVDVKGNGWTIADNVGLDAPEDGFQLHEIVDGWGMDNTFTGNNATVNADGFAFNITKNRENNRVSCDNESVEAGKGLSTVDYSP